MRRAEPHTRALNDVWPVIIGLPNFGVGSGPGPNSDQNWEEPYRSPAAVWLRQQDDHDEVNHIWPLPNDFDCHEYAA